MAGRPDGITGGRGTFTAYNQEQLFELLKDAFAFEWEWPIRVTIESRGDTYDYKALVHIWFRELAAQFNKRIGPVQVRPGESIAWNESLVHDLFCAMYFGKEPAKRVGQTELPERLITITYPRQKTRGELFDFCRRIEEFCAENGYALPIKDDSQYVIDKRAGA